jgi:hypothetical protein
MVGEGGWVVAGRGFLNFIFFKDLCGKYPNEKTGRAHTDTFDHFEFDCFVEVVVNFHNNSELEKCLG